MNGDWFSLAAGHFETPRPMAGAALKQNIDDLLHDGEVRTDCVVGRYLSDESSLSTTSGCGAD